MHIPSFRLGVSWRDTLALSLVFEEVHGLCPALGFQRALTV